MSGKSKEAHNPKESSPGQHRMAHHEHQPPHSHPHPDQSQADLAAAKIQAGFRGYKTRKELGHIHDTNSSHGHQSSASESGSHGASSSEHTPSHHPNINPDNAATRIQASFRGYKTRKALRDDNITKHTVHCSNHNKGPQSACPKAHDDSCHHTDDESRAATVIQAGFRGYQTRKHLEDIHHPHDLYGTSPNKENEEEAATRIQATYRGFAVRKKVKNLPRSKSECASSHSPHSDFDPEQAATKIQATFRGYLTRQHLHDTHPQ